MSPNLPFFGIFEDILPAPFASGNALVADPAAGNALVVVPAAGSDANPDPVAIPPTVVTAVPMDGAEGPGVGGGAILSIIFRIVFSFFDILSKISENVFTTPRNNLRIILAIAAAINPHNPFPPPPSPDNPES